jgi:hypothetical protein
MLMAIRIKSMQITVILPVTVITTVVVVIIRIITAALTLTPTAITMQRRGWGGGRGMNCM